MTIKSTEEKILTLNQNGKKGVNILKSRYDMMKNSIILILSSSESLSMGDLGQQIHNELDDMFDGKVGWYYMAVKLDLEARGIIERIPNKSPQTLKLKNIEQSTRKLAKTNLNNEVSEFLDEFKHPLRKEIDLLREIILTANSGLSENIKWNGPNYCVGNEDRITLRIQPTTSKQIQLIFHRGAKVKEQPKSKLINDNSGLLVWKEHDRAIATFKNIQEIENKKSDLHKIINEWINATKVVSQTNGVDSYISKFDPEIQARLNMLRQLFLDILPDTQESISYKIPCYKVGKHRLYFAGYKKHIGVYPVYGLEEIEGELSVFRAKGTKDSLHFLHSEPLPIELITKIIQLKSLK
jgi:uncharacterized protein YdhG (YjbR/CyaY superfamily)